jgi:hypothetical protein
VISLAAGLLVFLVAPRKRRRRHRLRRLVRLFRRPRSSLSDGYRAYIPDSPEWKRVRSYGLARSAGVPQQAIDKAARAGRALRLAPWEMPRCEHSGVLGRCNAHHGLQVHHLHYRLFRREWTGLARPVRIEQQGQMVTVPATHGECLRVLCGPHHRRADRRRKRFGG